MSTTAKANTDAPQSLREQTLEEIKSSMTKLGDLPIFSTSINQVRHVSNDPDSDAMELGHVVLKDTNLSAKLLRLANSANYNRGIGKIGTISRAVVVLGFDTIKNICLTLKLIESFQHSHPQVDISKLLIRSYLAAGFVKDAAIKCGAKYVEEAYIHALMHNLGEIAVAYFLPEKALQIQALSDKEGLSGQEAELQVLGMTATSVGQYLAKAWEFPTTIAASMVDFNTKQTVRNQQDLIHALAALSSQVMDSLYSEKQHGDRDFFQTLSLMADKVGLKVDILQNSLKNSFEISCDLAEEYGLSKKKLKPVIRDASDEDETRNKWAQMLAFYTSHDQMASVLEVEDIDAAPLAEGVKEASLSASATASTLPPSPTPTPASASSPPPAQAAPARTQLSPMTDTHGESSHMSHHQHLQHQLEAIQEITSLITQSAPINKIFVKILEGLRGGSSFDRAILCLLNADRSRYGGRLGFGEASEALKQYLAGPMDPTKDLFSKVMVEGNELLIEKIDQGVWKNMLPHDFFSSTQAKSFIVAGLRHGDKPIGLFYGDKAKSSNKISPDDYRDFMQFIAQARLAIKLLA